MVTSKKERKCIDSSSAGRAGIFYCSSWRKVFWLPVPPPAGAEDKLHFTGQNHCLGTRCVSLSCHPEAYLQFAQSYPCCGCTFNLTAHRIDFRISAEDVHCHILSSPHPCIQSVSWWNTVHTSLFMSPVESLPFRSDRIQPWRDLQRQVKDNITTTGAHIHSHTSTL